jgi:hypothetical protein
LYITVAKSKLSIVFIALTTYFQENYRIGKHGKFHIRSTGFVVLWLVICIVDKNLATGNRAISLKYGRVQGISIHGCVVYSRDFLFCVF